MDSKTQELLDENLKLRTEIEALKKFFGYDPESTLDEMEDYKTECEDEEQKIREEDPEYASKSNKVDEMVDLAVQLSECAFEFSKLYARMKKCSIKPITSLRKDFIYSFRSFRDAINVNQIEEFFELVKEWIDLEEKSHGLELSIQEKK